METEPAILVVGTEISPEAEEEWNMWYNEKHVPELLEVEGMIRVTRYKIFDDKEGPYEEGKYPKYLAIYEFENRQAAEAFATSPEIYAGRADWKKNWLPRGMVLKWRVYYEPIKTCGK